MEYVKSTAKVVEGLKNFEGIDEKMEKLKRKFQHLKSREEDVKEELKYAEELSLKKPRKVVENWLTNVGNIKNSIEQIEEQVRERRWFSYMPLEMEMGKLTEQVTELIQQGGFPEGLTLQAHGNQPIELITTKLIGQMFHQHKAVIWKYLVRNNVSKLGVWGMGGVGKTTLLTHIHNELNAHQQFSVSWVTVSQNFSIHKLQNDIAKTIGLQIENNDDERKRAAKLAQRLRNMKNFVLILDDLWQDFQLERVGIPSGRSGCKLILTSRSLNVCRSINCEEYIKVEPLSENEAWELFTEKLGHGRALSPAIEPIAKSLTKKCSGLPLAIISVAGSMREVDDISEWSDALEKLKESVADHDDEMGIEVFKVLKYSYDQLKDPKLQQCFIYCSLFPEDFEVGREMLIEYFINERFIDGLRSRQAELNRGHTILNKLENVCLLEGGVSIYGGRKYVKMHDLVRSMAIQIGKENFQYSVETEEQLTEILREEKWAKDLTKLSLMKKDISNIPSSASPKFPRLTTLVLNDCGVLYIIPDCFFSRMPTLSVLNLSGTKIGNLPTSICELVNLTALWLEGCSRLAYVPCLENLKALRRLNLRWTRIREVPQGMEMLLNLRYLNLEETLIEMIPDGILPKLSCLQYLGIENEIGRAGSSPPRKVRGEEIVKLRKLETFKGYLYDMDDFNKYVRWRENNRGGPNNYQLLVGPSSEFYRLSAFEGCTRSVCLQRCKISKSKNGEDSDSLPVLPTDVQLLCIQDCNDASSLCDIASLKNATQLSNCYIERCQGMEHVVCCCSCNLPLIQSLVSLILIELWELRALNEREICCASASASASSSSSILLQTPMFSSLQRLRIIGCPKIKRLFMPILLPNLKNLVHLTVQLCEEMVEITGESSDEDEDDVNQEAVSTSCIISASLPKLSILHFHDLPELKRFCSKEIVFDSLKEICISRCPKLSFNGVQHVETDYSKHIYSVVNSRIVERIR
ncbi:probable disease resistance protein At4g27220 [Ziziphus jujuba]|uniref:Probable disease resistance protein At4g27220 n=1 Tax=Ziziphus jujuba TaxID=326968 RepID=A0ABM3ZVG7_ZIZJJ|nr:probable disease resistance protein At4g27220 [Ziziphus jujuba]